VAALRLPAQQMNTPLGQLPTPQKNQSTSKPRDPAAEQKKDQELPDPTKDPTKDPSKDITRDPKGDPAKEADVAPDEPNLQDSRGADEQGGAAEAPDYTGPSILSRGFVLSRPAIPTNERFQAYVGVNAVYDSGLPGGYVQNGQLVTVNSYGGDLNWGISGRHYRRKDIFDLSYAGHFYQYHNGTTTSQQDQSFSAGYTREISPHFTVSVREVAGLYSNNFSVLNSVAIADTSLSTSTLVVAPNTEAFNDRTLYSSTQGSVIYQKSARLSFSASVAGFLVNRDSRLLANSTGASYTGDTAYRISKRHTLGVYYSHTDYQYTKVLSNSHADTVGGTYSATLSRTTDFSTRVGVTHIATQGLASVQVNPLVSSVLGITTGVEKFYVTTLAPDFTVTLNRRIQRSTLGLAYVVGITPGNGLVLTSRHQSGSISWDYTGFRKYSFQVATGRDVLSGYVNTVGAYTSYFGRLSMSHPLTRDITSVLAFDYRQQAIGTSAFHQKEWRISIGFRYLVPSELLRF
jgi:hypothetical protein